MWVCKFLFCVLTYLSSSLSSAALVPDSVKKELLQRIRAFLAQHATLWMTHFPFFFCLFVFTHSLSTSEIQTVVYCVHFSANFIFYCVFSYWFLVYAAVLEKKNKVMPILVILVVIATCLVDQNPKVQIN